jgi:hypothetical protein
VSKEAVALSLSWLEREAYVEVGADPGARGKRATLTPSGRASQAVGLRRRVEVDATWESDAVARLRSSLDAIIDDPVFGLGLVPPPMGWRGAGRYKPFTDAFVTDARSGLPDHPMVLHRGGWPDGS